MTIELQSLGRDIPGYHQKATGRLFLLFRWLQSLGRDIPGYHLSAEYDSANPCTLQSLGRDIPGYHSKKRFAPKMNRLLQSLGRDIPGYHLKMAEAMTATMKSCNRSVAISPVTTS